MFGFLDSNYYGIFVALAILVYFIIVKFLSKDDNTIILMFSATSSMVCLFCSRLVYVAVNFAYYIFEIENPKAMFFVWDGGFSLTGLLLGLLLSLSLIKKYARDYIKLYNASFAALGVFISIIRLAERFTNVGIGKSLSDDVTGIFVIKDAWGFSSIAVYKIEALIALIIAIILITLFIKLYNKKSSINYPYIVWLFFILYGGTQVIMESIRNDGHMMLLFVHAQQIFAFAMPVIVSIIVLKQLRKKNIKTSLNVIAPISFIILLALGMALEFVLDGRLHFNLKLFGISDFARNYILFSLICIILMALSIYIVYTLYKYDDKKTLHN
ncbi:MAG: hypothetical protein GYA87_08895 [Christensenellaceae bacterium]|nr:hypothetical protein [Christensenellaceae bacterium]